MSVSYIPDHVKTRLWGKAAGRCQYEGCNESLFYDALTKSEFNISYIAHIYADSPQGPRFDPVYSPKLKADISNLMLLCDKHHRLIDRQEVKAHCVERLQRMKSDHEKRISLISSVIPDRQSHIVLFGANIGQQQVPLNFNEAANAIIPNKYPYSLNPIELGLKNLVLEDHHSSYWLLQDEQVKEMFQREIVPIKHNHNVKHFSVFALAPIPLLVRLGSLFSDIYDVDVYQRHREPCCWNWQNDESQIEFIIKIPRTFDGIPVLKLSLSASISDDRVIQEFQERCSIWEVSIPTPHNDFLRSRDMLSRFRTVLRKLLNEIKLKHGQNGVLHVFPAMPVATSVELGRVWMPKSDLPLQIYDQNNKSQSFKPAIIIK